jgi:hypothetical protein
VFTYQVLLWIAVQDGWPVRWFAESLGERWLDSTEARLLAESRQAREESSSFPPYCDHLFPAGTVCTPLVEIREDYIMQAAEQLRLSDERQLRRAIEILDDDGMIELIDQRTGAEGEDFESIGNWFRRYGDEELRGVYREWSQGSLRSTANGARWNQLVVLTGKGQTRVGAMREAYASDVGRRNAARDARLAYLRKGNHLVLWNFVFERDPAFEQDPRCFYWGQRFRPNDYHDATKYLLEKNLIHKSPTRSGDTLEITGKGIDCIERHDGSVSSFLDKEVPVRDIYHVGQAGVVGPGAQAKEFTMNQVISEGVNIQKLAEELARLRAELKKRSTNEAEHDLAIGAVASAELAAKNGDRQSTSAHLARAGKWALDVATSIGTTLASAAIKAAMGIQ